MTGDERRLDDASLFIDRHSVRILAEVSLRRAFDVAVLEQIRAVDVVKRVLEPNLLIGLILKVTEYERQDHRLLPTGDKLIDQIGSIVTGIEVANVHERIGITGKYAGACSTVDSFLTACIALRMMMIVYDRRSRLLCDFVECITELADNVLRGCRWLTSIDIPNNITNISYDAFSYCKSLQEIPLPENLESIQYEAFSNFNRFGHNLKNRKLMQLK